MEYPCNYGAFPQTWENPLVHDPHTDANGDNDPLDVCEIGSQVRKTGDVVQVKILGTWAMIDEGETDWKILAIDVNDPDAEKYNNVSDVPKEKLDAVFTFLRDYKIPDGNPPNKFAFDNECKDRDFALKITGETHEEWHKLSTGKIPSKGDKYNIEVASTQPGDSAYHISQEEAEKVLVEQFQTFLRAKN
eukprot:TRINITY_DN1380_c0_g1_i2.p1 TRINITY_DN1380_c0_g1~~TRINITY_DN1380_c0_g1_i2.p1  ORF type:complete len:190 (+),score=58.25 TRINITY_DN1380_c0_g1_i2:339-908(+)